MGNITSIVNAWAEQQWDKPNWTMSDDGARASLAFTSSTKNDFTYRAFCDVDEDNEVVEIYLYAPVTVPIDKRHLVADAVARINIHLFFGRIDLNMDDGVLRFRAGIDAHTATITAESLKQLLDKGNSTLDKYLPAISEVVFAGTSPAQAVANANGDVSGAVNVEPEPVPDAPPWEKIAGASLLMAWAQELRIAIAAKDEAEWADVGRGVVLVSDNSEHCQAALQRVVADAGMRFVHIEEADVMDLPPRAAFEKSAPALIYLAPGHWLCDRQKEDSDADAAKVSKFQSRLVQWIKKFDAAQPVVVCTMVFGLGDMASTLDGPGRFDRYFVMPKLNDAARGAAFVNNLGPQLCGESIRQSLAKVGKCLAAEFNKNERLEMAKLYLRRLARREQRPVELLDLIYLSAYGFGEETRYEPTTDEERRQTAVHEAGHAAMSILDTAGGNVPDYCSIAPGVGCKGVVVESLARQDASSSSITYADFRHVIRVGLAGRAAEELMFGTDGVSSGSAHDLSKAWKRASLAFARWGFAPQMENADASSANLAVVVGEATPSETVHLESLIRKFMTTEYGVVLNALRNNTALVSAIVERLLQKTVVDQAELLAIHQEVMTGAYRCGKVERPTLLFG